MPFEQIDPAGPATDRRRIGVWENEGGCLERHGQAAVAAPGSQPFVDDGTTGWMLAVPLSDLPDEGTIHLDLSGNSVRVNAGDDPCIVSSRVVATGEQPGAPGH